MTCAFAGSQHVQDSQQRDFGPTMLESFAAAAYQAGIVSVLRMPKPETERPPHAATHAERTARPKADTNTGCFVYGVALGTAKNETEVTMFRSSCPNVSRRCGSTANTKET